jgi:hypothetical protein
VTGAVEARLVGDDTVTFAVVLEHVVTSCTYTKGEFFKEKKKDIFLKEKDGGGGGGSAIFEHKDESSFWHLCL